MQESLLMGGTAEPVPPRTQKKVRERIKQTLGA